MNKHNEEQKDAVSGTQRGHRSTELVIYFPTLEEALEYTKKLEDPMSYDIVRPDHNIINDFILNNIRTTIEIDRAMGPLGDGPRIGVTDAIIDIDRDTTNKGQKP